MRFAVFDRHEWDERVGEMCYPGFDFTVAVLGRRGYWGPDDEDWFGFRAVDMHDVSAICRSTLLPSLRYW